MKTKKQEEGYFKLWWEIISRPHEIFKEMKIKSLRAPTVYLLKTMAMMWGSIYLFIGAIAFFIVLFAASQRPGLLFSIGIGVVIALVLYPLLLLYSWGMAHLNALIIHLFIEMFGGKGKYKETYGSFCYSYAPYITLLVPVIGSVASIYSIVLLVFGLKDQHKLSVGKAIACILLPIVVFVFLALLIFASIFAFGVI